MFVLQPTFKKAENFMKASIKFCLVNHVTLCDPLDVQQSKRNGCKVLVCVI